MSRPIGTTKTGGRKKGTPNRRTSELTSALEELGLDIPSKIHELLSELPPAKQVDTLLSLMPYIYPRRKPKDAPEREQKSIADLMLAVERDKDWEAKKSKRLASSLT